MKKTAVFSIILIILSVLAFFSTRFLDRFNASEKMRAEKAEYSWLKKTSELSRAPLALQDIDRLIHQEKWKQARNEIDALVKQNPELTPILKHREAEVLYRYGVSELSNLMFFTEKNMPEEMDESRGYSAKSLNLADGILESLANSESRVVRFSAADGAGDVNVRLAALAISKTERSNALSKAVEYYIKALLARDDYETKVKLELLLDIKKQSSDSDSQNSDKKASPKNFQLVPLRRPGSGAAVGRHPQSPL